ncbi:uncharacterized protein LOC120282161 [Dioscorea cayenensis subsp. rotundata]|uniref:Uncharacterized protein LOC120282161 n=1 Tax=Dioscorea cayennensis subsp. rotundata TaxID=55577 RepID=A0AB40CZM1_DIOCR|nr:uncharacterized protein LOC120282161 [Dioscorea cayenensis subsp. rotundata]
MSIWRSIGGSRLDHFAFLPAIGSAVGIIVGWNNLLFDGKVLHVGSFCLSIEFINKANNITWVCTSVYGPNARNLKQSFWNEIRSCQPGGGLPWVICGDFNSIFASFDKSSGVTNREDIRLAQAFLCDLQLMEPPSNGNRFTWTNGQSNPIWVKLDRFLINSHWVTLFPKVLQNYLPRLGSDHVPIRLEVGFHLPSPRSFRFEQAWCLTDNFDMLIREWWSSPNPCGCGAFILAKKITSLRENLKTWAKFEFGSIKLKKLGILHEMDVLDRIRETRSLTPVEINAEVHLRTELGAILKQEETYWKQRARMTWFKEGDENTKFFHLVANGRRNRNFIPWVLRDNVRVEDFEGIGRTFTSFYQNLYGTEQTYRHRINWTTLLGSKGMHNLSNLDAPFTLEEIKVAVFGMRADKAPGPDGFPMLFFQKFWDIVKGGHFFTREDFSFEGVPTLKGLIGQILPDCKKAFDSVDWGFLLELLRARGFGERWIGWVRTILASSKAKFLVNNAQCGYVRFRRGLRQGDPLSPLLFVLVVDVLSSMFNHALNTGILHGIPLGGSGVKMCHLQYADDLLVMSTGGAEDLRIIKLILYVFEGLSGLAINSEKTCLYTSQKNLEPQAFLARTLHCSVGVLPLTYLGIPISGGKPRKQDWDILINKVRSRLEIWKSKFLSLGGRLTLLNSVLIVIPTYWMSLFKLPCWVIRSIDRIRRDFLWSGPDLHHPKILLVNWATLCRSREQGGWNILNLEVFNNALLGKWWWKIILGARWCGAEIFRENYFGSRPTWNLFHKQYCRRSVFWNGILKILPAFWKNICSLVKGGSTTLFWLDNWVEGRAPADIWPHLFLSSRDKEGTVRDLFNGGLTLPFGNFSREGSQITSLCLQNCAIKDDRSWGLSSNGVFSVRSFYHFLNDGGLRCRWTPSILKGCCPRKINLFNWLVWDNKILTLQNLAIRRFTGRPSHPFFSDGSVGELAFPAPDSKKAKLEEPSSKLRRSLDFLSSRDLEQGAQSDPVPPQLRLLGFSDENSVIWTSGSASSSLMKAATLARWEENGKKMMRTEDEEADVVADMEQKCTCGKITNVVAFTIEDDMESSA